MPFRILSVEASDAVKRERMRKRRQTGDDASEAGLQVLTQQQQLLEPLTTTEQEFVLRINNDQTLDPGHVLAALKALF